MWLFEASSLGDSNRVHGVSIEIQIWIMHCKLQTLESGNTVEQFKPLGATGLGFLRSTEQNLLWT